MALEVNLKDNIWKMYAFSFISSLHFTGGVLIPFFTEWGKISFFQVMILQAFFLVFVFLLETPTGAVADKYGRKVSVGLGILSTMVGAIIYVIYPSFYLFLFAEFMWAIGSALISGADESLVYDTLRGIKKENKSKKVFGRIGSCKLAGYMVAAPIGSLIAAYLGIQYAMLLIAVPLFFAFLIILNVEEPKVGRKKAEKRSYFETLKQGWKYFGNHKILKILAFDGAVTSALAFFIIWVYQYKLQALNVPLAYFGFIHLLLVAGQIFVLNSFSFFEKVAGSKKRYLLLSAIIPGLLFILLGLTLNVYLSIFSIIIISALGLTRKTLFSNYMHKFIPSDKRAVVISTIAMISSFTMVVNDLVMGFLVKWNLKYGLILLGLFIIVFSLVSRVKEEHLRD
ncbi:MAG: MFS transporter [Nanoarchaeota archaeon]